MKKVFNEDQLKEKANQTFADFPTANEVHATTDGNIFLDKNRAELHATPKGQVFTFPRPVDAESEPQKPMRAEDAIAAIKATTTIEELEKFATDDRKSVAAAYQKQLDALKASHGNNAQNQNPENRE